MSVLLFPNRLSPIESLHLCNHYITIIPIVIHTLSQKSWKTSIGTGILKIPRPQLKDIKRHQNPYPVFIIQNIVPQYFLDGVQFICQCVFMTVQCLCGTDRAAVILKIRLLEFSCSLFPALCHMQPASPVPPRQNPGKSRI